MHSPFYSWGKASGLFCSNKIQVKSRCNSRKASTYPRYSDILKLFITPLSWSPLLGQYCDDSEQWVLELTSYSELLLPVVSRLRSMWLFQFDWVTSFVCVCVCVWSQNLNLIFITSESKMLDIITPFHILKVWCMVLKGLCPRLALFQHYPLAIEPVRFLSAILVVVLIKMLLCHSQGTH